MLGGTVTKGANDKGRNECVAFSPEGRLLARYCKMQPFTLGGEMKHYSAGPAVARFEWGGFSVSPFICYDLRFPELFREATRRGASLLVVIANWPIVRVDHWVTLLRARAIENLAYVVGVNRCGTDPALVYPGRSIVVDPKGRRKLRLRACFRPAALSRASHIEWATTSPSE